LEDRDGDLSHLGASQLGLCFFNGVSLALRNLVEIPATVTARRSVTDHAVIPQPGARRCHHIVEESRRQESAIVGVGTWRFSQVKSRPHELIDFIDHNPGAFQIKAKTFLDDLWDLDAGTFIHGPPMRDWQHRHKLRAILFLLDRCDDHAGAIFATFLQSRCRVVAPQIGIPNHKTRLGRLRQRHEPPSVRIIKQFIEMIVTRVHPRGEDRFRFLLRQIRRSKDPPPHGFQLLPLLILTWRYEIPTSVPWLETGTAWSAPRSCSDRNCA
jgi:hypothetical protein